MKKILTILLLAAIFVVSGTVAKARDGTPVKSHPGIEIKENFFCCPPGVYAPASPGVSSSAFDFYKDSRIISQPAESDVPVSASKKSDCDERLRLFTEQSISVNDEKPRFCHQPAHMFNKRE